MSDEEREPASKIRKKDEGIGNSDETTESRLMALPNEIWSMIFEYIPQTDLVSHRFVSKKWCGNIDTLAGFHVSFRDNDQDEMTLDRLSKLRVRSCEYRYLHKEFIPKLTNPSLLKKVVIAPSAASNVKNFLSTFTSIESLAFYTLLSLDRYFDSSYDHLEVFRSLKNLKEIDICIHSIFARNEQRSSIFDTIIGNDSLVFPSLRKVRFCFSCCSSSEWKQLFNWLSRHQKTLVSVELSCSCLRENEISDDDLSEINMKNLLSLKLKSLKLVCDSAKTSTVHSVYEKLLWAQDSLESLFISFCGMNVNDYLSVIKNSASTLRSVKCFNVFLTERAVTLDESLFANNRLEELVFQCIPAVVFVPLDWDGFRRYNPSIVGWQLPKYVKRLHVQGCSIPTQELINFCDLNSESVQSLQELTLINVGDSVGYGVTLQSFQKICSIMVDLKVFRLSPIFGTGDSDPKTPMEEECSKMWKRIVEAGKIHDVYENEEEDREVIHVFKFNEVRNKDVFLKTLEEIVVDGQTNYDGNSYF